MSYIIKNQSRLIDYFKLLNGYERRVFDRLGICNDVIVKDLSNGGKQMDTLLDVSFMGGCLHSIRSRILNDHLEVEINNPALGKNIVLNGKVIWSKNDSAMCTYGVKFNKSDILNLGLLWR